MNKLEQIKIARRVLELFAEHNVTLRDVAPILSIANVLLVKTEGYTNINLQSLNSACEEYISSISERRKDA